MDIVITEHCLPEMVRDILRDDPGYDMIVWLDAAALAERQLPNHLGSGQLRLVGPDRYVYYPTPEEPGGGDRAAAFLPGGLDADANESAMLYSDVGMQALICTKDVEAAQDAADAAVDLTDFPGAVGAEEVDRVMGFALAGHVFRLTLGEYGGHGDDVLTFWAGTTAEVWARLEALPDRAPKASPRRGTVGKVTAYTLIKQLQSCPDVPLRFRVGKANARCYEAIHDVYLSWAHEPDVVIVSAAKWDVDVVAAQGRTRQGAVTTHELAGLLQGGPNRLVQLRTSADDGHRYGKPGDVDLSLEYTPNAPSLVPISAVLHATAEEPTG